MKTTSSNRPLTRRDFLRLAALTGGAVTLSPLLKACSRLTTAAPAPALTATAAPLGPTPAEDLLAGLDGLNIDTFFQEAFRRWIVRDPENLTTLGLADLYGVGDANLTDISDGFLRQTQALESGTLDLLRLYDRSTFTAAQALTADVYDWFLDDLERGHEFMYNDYPVNPIVTSVHYNLYMLFTVYHPLNNKQDAEDYISRLSQVGAKLSRLIDGLRRREEHGVILPSFLLSYVIPDITSLSSGAPTYHTYYSVFNDRLTSVTAEERKNLLARAEEQVKNTVIPAYQELANFLIGQQSRASNDVGVWQFPDGAAYYAQSLRRQNTTELTADEIHELGKQNVARVQSEMRTLFDRMGYPAGDDIPSLYNRLAGDSGVYSGQNAVAAYEAAIQNAEALLPQAFDILPRASVKVIGGPDGDYYMPASYDGSRPGLFYARTDGQTPKFGVKTLAYHETIPGHHLQTAIAQEQTGLPALRQGMQFNAYTEGWALYAERLMWELGAYADDPQGDLGRLQLEAFRAARLVVDTGIHAMRWSFDQATSYLASAAGFTEGRAQNEIARYCVWPGQATSYYIGFLKFLELRQRAKDVLGGKFDLKAFHHVILVNGSIPLSTLEKLVDSYTESTK